MRQKSNYSFLFNVLMIGFFGYIFFDCIYFQNYWAFGIQGINIAIHEGGHIFFGFFGNEFLAVAGGTLMQLLVPLLIMLSLGKQKDYFGASILFAILGINLFSISVYVGDAEQMALPILQLFGPGYDYIHDWNYMFTHLGLLDHTQSISFGIRVCGIACFCIFFAYASFLTINQLRK